MPRTGISSGTLRSAIEYGLPLPLQSAGGVGPPAPVDVKVTWDQGAVHISWHPPPASSLPVLHYSVQYRTVQGRWIPLAFVPASVTSYRWTTAGRDTTYLFRLFTFGPGQVYSQPSPAVSIQTPESTAGHQ